MFFCLFVCGLSTRPPLQDSLEIIRVSQSLRMVTNPKRIHPQKDAEIGNSVPIGIRMSSLLKTGNS